MLKIKTTKRRTAQHRQSARDSTPTNKESLLQLWAWFLPTDIFATIIPHGDTKWKTLHLVNFAFFWTWSDARHRTEGFIHTAESAHALFGVVGINAYQGFMHAQVTWSPTLVGLLVRVLRERMEHIGSCWWRINGWVPIAFDGWRSLAPRTRANRLGWAVTDVYRREPSKKTRYRPANPDKKPLGDPKLRVLTRKEKRKLREMDLNLAA